jgi:hypothetical protein
MLKADSNATVDAGTFSTSHGMEVSIENVAELVLHHFSMSNSPDLEIGLSLKYRSNYMVT